MDMGMLVRLAQDGEEEARSELLKRATRLVYARVFKVVKNHSEAEDIAQDALVAALMALPDLRNPGAFLAWLRRIADNVIADHFEKCRRLPVGNGDAREAVTAPENWPDRIFERSEQKKRVRAALETLQTRNRLALELFYFHDLTSRQVAEFLHISDDAARAALSRSRKELKRSIIAMTGTKNAMESRIRHSVKEGSDTVSGPVFEHDSDAATLYLALYPFGGSGEAALTGLPPARIREELDLLQDMRLIVQEENHWRCTMPVVGQTDLEIIRLWAEPIAEKVIRNLDRVQSEMAALVAQTEGDLAKHTVETFGLIEAADRPFKPLRAQMNASAPDRGRFGRFCTAVFTGEIPGKDIFSGGLSCVHSSDDSGEVYVHYFHPHQTSRARIAHFEQKFSLVSKGDPAILDALRKTGLEALRTGFTPALRNKMADLLAIAKDRRDEFWTDLASLHVVAERNGRMEVTLPSLPLAPWKNYLSLLDEIGKGVVEEVTDAADDLRKRVVLCSFADCFFADSATVFFTYLKSLVQQAIGERTPLAFQEEADYSWGALLIA